MAGAENVLLPVRWLIPKRTVGCRDMKVFISQSLPRSLDLALTLELTVAATETDKKSYQTEVALLPLPPSLGDVAAEGCTGRELGGEDFRGAIAALWQARRTSQT